MRLCLSALLALSLLPLSAAPQRGRSKAKPKPKPASASQIQEQVKRLQAERDVLKEKLASYDGVQQELAASQRSRDLAREEAEKARKDLDLIKSSLSENKDGGEALLQDLTKAKREVVDLTTQNERLAKELDQANARLTGKVGEGALLPITPDITPARPMNLRKVTPKAKKVDRGVVVVNVLVSEIGEVLDAKLLQGLPGEGEWVLKANEACVDAAKRVVFDPARAADGKTRIRVWQGVGFLLD